jgi:hypothetical protein
MYGFKIKVKLVGTRPGNLDEMLDVVTDQLTLMCAREAEFEDFMVIRHTSGDATFLIVVNRDAEAEDGMTDALRWQWARFIVWIGSRFGHWEWEHEFKTCPTGDRHCSHVHWKIGH